MMIENALDKESGGTNGSLKKRCVSSSFIKCLLTLNGMIL